MQIRFEQTLAGTPATAQQEADDEADKWSMVWGAGTVDEQLQWPEDMGEDLSQIVVEELLDPQIKLGKRLRRHLTIWVRRHRVPILVDLQRFRHQANNINVVGQLQRLVSKQE